MANPEKVFAKGFNFTRRDNAPDWVVGKLSLKASEAIEFIKQNAGTEWLNLNICQGKQGNFYVELDTWKPTPKQDSAPVLEEPQGPGPSSDDLPF